MIGRKLVERLKEIVGTDFVLTSDMDLALYSYDRVVPGHGPTTDRDGIRQFKRFLVQLGAIGRQAAAEGWTLEQTRQTADLTADAGYEPIRFIVSLGLDRGFVLQRAWEESTGNFERVEAALDN